MWGPISRSMAALSASMTASAAGEPGVLDGAAPPRAERPAHGRRDQKGAVRARRGVTAVTAPRALSS